MDLFVQQETVTWLRAHRSAVLLPCYFQAPLSVCVCVCVCVWVCVCGGVCVCVWWCVVVLWVVVVGGCVRVCESKQILLLAISVLWARELGERADQNRVCVCVCV